MQCCVVGGFALMLLFFSFVKCYHAMELGMVWLIIRGGEDGEEVTLQLLVNFLNRSN